MLLVSSLIEVGLYLTAAVWPGKFEFIPMFRPVKLDPVLKRPVFGFCGVKVEAAVEKDPVLKAPVGLGFGFVYVEVLNPGLGLKFELNPGFGNKLGFAVGVNEVVPNG